MRACIVAYTIYESDNRVRRYAEALVESGIATDVIALKRRSDDSRRTTINGVNLIRVQSRDYNEKGFQGYLFRILAFFLKGSLSIFMNHVKNRYDFIHINNVPDFLVFMGVIPSLLGSSIILDIHDILPEFFCEKFNRAFESRFVKLAILEEKLSVRFADYVIVANDIWRERIIQRAGIPEKKCTALLNYPNSKYYSRTTSVNSSRHLNIIYPGTISHLHGIDIAIKAIAIVRRRFPYVHLKIYGRFGNLEYRFSLQKMIEELGLLDNVRFFNAVTNDELTKIYQDIDIGIVPKRNGVFSGEAFSTKILDYMMVGIPVIASRTKIDEFYFNDSQILFFRSEDHEDLSRRIIDLHLDPVKRDSLVMNADLFIRENTWEQKKIIYFNIIKEIVDRKAKKYTRKGVSGRL